MTAIAIWCAHDNSQKATSLWVAADSRIFTEKGDKEDGAKIFSLPVVCRLADEKGFLHNEIYRHSFGYCFAGSTLMGQNSFLAMLPLLSNLACHKPYVPSLREVAMWVWTFFNRSQYDFGQKSGNFLAFEAAIFGYCHQEKCLAAYRFFPEFEQERLIVKYEHFRDLPEGEFVYLGDDRDNMRGNIRSAFTNKIPGDRNWRDAPRHVISDAINAGSHPSIGGDLQLGYADSSGFHPLAVYRPEKLGEPKAYRSFLGYRLTPEISTLGSALVCMNAIPVDP